MKDMINIALPKGRLGDKVYDMFEAAGYPCPSIREDSRKLIFESEETGVRYFWVKPSDVAIYVERGAADIGVAGRDILLEYEPDIYELLDLGVKLDGSLSWWGGEHGRVQKMWLVNPEVRWYLWDKKRFYVGASGSYGEYNIYKYMLGGIVSKDTGYQGKLWNAGLTAGYQLYLSRDFSIDFNLGLSYTRSEYDSFGMTDGVRVYKERNKSKHFWGPTQAGISLVWTIGSK